MPTVDIHGVKVVGLDDVSSDQDSDGLVTRQALHTQLEVRHEWSGGEGSTNYSNGPVTWIWADFAS